MSVTWTWWPSDPTYTREGYWDWRPPWVQPAVPTSIRWAVKQTVAPATEPVSLQEAKNQLRVDTPDDDQFISDLIRSAREFAEVRTGLALLTQTFVLQLDRFPSQDRLELWPQPGLPLGSIILPRPPLQSVSSVVWVDQNGASTTVANSTYVVDTTSKPGRIAPQVNAVWPSTSSPGMAALAGVLVTYVAGYTSVTLVPQVIRQAMRLMIGHWYLNREEVAVDNRLVAIEIPQGADDLLALAAPPMVG